MAFKIHRSSKNPISEINVTPFVDVISVTFTISIGITVGIFIGADLKKSGKPITKIKKIQCKQKEK